MTQSMINLPAEQYNETALYLLIREDKERVFKVLFENYSAALLGHLSQMLRNHEDAEEALQESFIKIWKNLESYDPSKGRVFTWMLRIVRNTGIDFVRKNKNKQSKQSKTELENVSLPGSESRIEDAGLMAIIERLDDNQKFLVHKLIFEGFTQQEVADEFDIPLGTVKSRFRAAMKKLRENLSEEQFASILLLLNYLLKS
jgi:RNA polymerase sigma factor (sigma-70 family)